MSGDERVILTCVTSPRPFFITVKESRCIIQVEVIEVRHVLGSRHTESILFTPVGDFCFADRTNIHEELRTGFECSIIVMLHTIDFGLHYDNRRIHRLDGVGFDRFFSDDYVELVCVPAGLPSDSSLTCASRSEGEVAWYGTLRCRADNNAVQHNTTTKVIFTLEGYLVSLRILGQ